jgi:sigma-B regulation protein RsbU (phosphoserine phosphatase)
MNPNPTVLAPRAPPGPGQSVAEDLQQAAFFRERLMRILGHDLRATLDPEQSRNLARISRSADRLTFMIRDLLDYTHSRLGGGIPIAPRLVNGHAMLRELVREFERTHPTRDFVLETAGEGSGEWDAMRLSHLATNLIENAVLYGRADTPVSLLAIDDGAIWTLEVHNQGRVIPADLLPVLTDPFRRAMHPDGRRLPSKGLGLGLSIAEQIAAAHGGTLEARSSAENGTTFTARLPRRATARLDPAHSRSAVLEWLDRAWS